MNRLAMVTLVVLVAMSVCYAQDAAPAQAPAGPSQAGAASDEKPLRGVIPVTLAKSIDSKKMKEGDPVTAKTVAGLHASGGVMIPSGSTVIGHVTQSSSRSKGDPQSALGIMFDKVEIAGGKDMPIKGVIQAVGPNPSESSGPDTGAGGSATMGSRGGDQTVMASPVAAPNTNLGQKGGQSSGGGKMLNSKSEGVVGIKNLQLDNNSVLTSTGKEVKLDQGSQILIKAE